MEEELAIFRRKIIELEAARTRAHGSEGGGGTGGGGGGGGTGGGSESRSKHGVSSSPPQNDVANNAASGKNVSSTAPDAGPGGGPGSQGYNGKQGPRKRQYRNAAGSQNPDRKSRLSSTDLFKLDDPPPLFTAQISRDHMIKPSNLAGMFMKKIFFWGGVIQATILPPTN